MNAWNVGNFVLSVTFLILRDFMYEKDLMSAVNVGHSFSVTVPCVVIRVFTLENGLMPAMNVGNVFLVLLISISMIEFMVQKCNLSEVNYEKSFNCSHFLHCH